MEITTTDGYLPYGRFEWVDTNTKVTSVSDDADEGYMLNVDLTYLQNVHDEHKYIPFCPKHMTPTNCPKELL